MIRIVTGQVLPLWLALVGVAFAADVESHEPRNEAPASLVQRDTLTDGWFGLAEQLERRALTVNLDLTQAYQFNVDRGISTHRRAGRYAGSYDLEVEMDFERMLGLADGSMYIHAEGSWSDGIDASSVGSLFGVNDDAGGDRAIDVSELWYEQGLLDGVLRLRVGKVDLTRGFECRGCPVTFDGNSFANDETAQFLNGALVNNPAIPFPDNGLGAILYYQPVDWLYAGAGVADAQSDAREVGFRTAFHDEDDFFTIVEAGVVPQIASKKGALLGAYRIGLWYDPQAKDHLDGAGSKDDDVGFYVSVDQMLWRESAEPDDDQGLGAFARYGWADEEVNEVRTFWSVGCQYQGLIPSRDDDVLAFGVAQGRLSRDVAFSAPHETVMEMYYNAQVTGWLNVSPSIQYINNPGGDKNVDDAVALGVRVQMSF